MLAKTCCKTLEKAVLAKLENWIVCENTEMARVCPSGKTAFLLAVPQYSPSVHKAKVFLKKKNTKSKTSI
jgi:hypothetical protein